MADSLRACDVPHIAFGRLLPYIEAFRGGFPARQQTSVFWMYGFPIVAWIASSRFSAFTYRDVKAESRFKIQKWTLPQQAP